MSEGKCELERDRMYEEVEKQGVDALMHCSNTLSCSDDVRTRSLFLVDRLLRRPGLLGLY